MRNKILLIFVGFGIAAQALVPAWMLLKHHLILTKGEKVTVSVTYYDPRDLFMGHYVQLSVNGKKPDALYGIPQNYLRYYCDQRYAKALDSGIRNGKAELDVRVWRGSALAEELRIDGMPAYEYVEKVSNSPVTAKEVITDDVTRPRFERVLSVESADYYSLSPQGRVVIVGENLNWNREKSDEGFFFSEEGSTNNVPCEIIEVFKEGTGYLLRPGTPLRAKNYQISLIYRKDNNLLSESDWHRFQIKVD